MTTPHRGQLAMANRLAESNDQRLMFVHGIGWHYWTGTRWAQDDQGVAHQAVHAVRGAALIEALGSRDDDLRTDVRRCETANAIIGILAIASTLVEFAQTARNLDTDPHLINVANGTLDLRTGQLRRHDPMDRITMITRAAYRPELAGATWQQFLRSVLLDPELRAFLKRLLGVALLGNVVEYVLPILTGTGANGKGALYKAVLWALGDYASTAEPRPVQAP